MRQVADCTGEDSSGKYYESSSCEAWDMIRTSWVNVWWLCLAGAEGGVAEKDIELASDSAERHAIIHNKSLLCMEKQ